MKAKLLAPCSPSSRSPRRLHDSLDRESADQRLVEALKVKGYHRLVADMLKT